MSLLLATLSSASTFSHTASGGVQTGGAGVIVRTLSASSSGGITTSGTATVSLVSVQPSIDVGGGGGGFFFSRKAANKAANNFTHTGTASLSVYGWNDGEFVPSPENIEEEELLAAFLNG